MGNGWGQSGLEGDTRVGDYQEGDRESPAGLDCSFSQCRAPYAGGSAGHSGNAAAKGIYLRAHLSTDSERGVYHRSHRAAAALHF